MNPFLKLIVAVSISLIPSVLVFYFLVFPVHREVKRTKTKLFNVKRELRELSVYERSYSDIKKEIGELRAKYRDLKIVLPKSPDIPSLIDEVTSLSRRLGISILKVKVDKKKKQKELFYIPVKLEVKGYYHSLGLFLYNLSVSRRAVGVSNFQFKRIEKEKLVTATCNMKVYFLR